VRQTLLSCLLDAARRDNRILLLSGDHGYALFDEFRAELPGQFLNCGIAEQNMVGVASGLAKAGFRPVVYGLSAFVPMRVLEQIKLDVCYENRRVIFLGDGAGLVYAQLGVSHQCCEDVAALRPLRHMSILSPADVGEMQACANLALENPGPVYLRVGKCDAATIHEGPVKLNAGNMLALTRGSGSIAWLATGSMVHRAMHAARHWPGSAVWSVPCIKPVNGHQLESICRRHRMVITLEEHCPEGGLGSLVCEVASKLGSARVCRIGVENPFLHCCGSYDYLMEQHGLGVETIVARVKEFQAEGHSGLRAFAA
jgi:transketolase